MSHHPRPAKPGPPPEGAKSFSGLPGERLARNTECPPWLRAAADGAELAVHVQPGAGKAEIVGAHGEALKIRLMARPVEGAANAALIAFIADTLGLARREVRIRRGEKSRQKVVQVSLDAPETARRLLEHASKTARE